MLVAGMVALTLVPRPFCCGLFQGAGVGVSSCPIIFEIRSFLQLKSFVKDWTPFARSLVMLWPCCRLTLLMELGFFFIAGLVWFTGRDKSEIRSNSFYLAEVILFGATLVGDRFVFTLHTDPPRQPRLARLAAGSVHSSGLGSGCVG